METPTTPEVNLYSDIWPLEHNAEIWGHLPTDDVFKPDQLDKKKAMSEDISAGEDCHEAHEQRDNPPRPSDKHYDIAEILAALSDITEKEIKQIKNFARFRLIGKAGKPSYVEVEDLFSDAAIRTIKQKRSWKRGVSPRNHFFAVMRSIGHQRFKQAGRFMPLNELVAAPQDWSLSALDAQTTVARLKEGLREDAMALNILETMMDEMRPRDAQRFLGISANVYSAARKRIRRRAKNLPGALFCSGARGSKGSSRRKGRTLKAMNRVR